MRLLRFSDYRQEAKAAHRDNGANELIFWVKAASVRVEALPWRFFLLGVKTCRARLRPPQGREFRPFPGLRLDLKSIRIGRRRTGGTFHCRSDFGVWEPKAVL